MKKFIINMLSSADDVSHKRVIAVLAFVVLILLAFISAYGHTADSSILYILASLAGGESVLTTIEKFQKPQS